MKDDKLYLVHILECIQRIETYTVAGRDAFMSDTRTQDAVIRNFEIIGEATKRISDETRKKAAAVPWRRIAGLRDVLIHEYEGIDPNEVWLIVEQELSKFKAEIQTLLSLP